MTGAPARTNFNDSGLVRLLDELALTSPGDSARGFAERLAESLAVTDAIALSALLGAGKIGAAGKLPLAATPSTDPSGQRTATLAALAGVETRFAEVRDALIAAIEDDGATRPGQSRLKLPPPAAGDDPLAAADYSPWHRYYVSHQRAMASAIGALQVQIRSTLSGHSAALGQLAALDAALLNIVSERERQALATVPLLLEKRFAHWQNRYGVHGLEVERTAQTAESAGAAVSVGLAGSATALPEAAWRVAFCRELQQVLLAELDVRLQPLIGLIEAFRNEVTQQQ